MTGAAIYPGLGAALLAALPPPAPGTQAGSPQRQAEIAEVNRLIEAGEFQRAAVALEVFLERDRHRPPDDMTAVAWCNLGLAWHELGRREDSGRAYRRAIATNTKLYGSGHPVLAHS